MLKEAQRQASERKMAELEFQKKEADWGTVNRHVREIKQVRERLKTLRSQETKQKEVYESYESEAQEAAEAVSRAEESLDEAKLL